MESLAATELSQQEREKLQHKQKADLKILESRLKNSVDTDLFQDPSSFRTLTRVIDVLGAQLLDTDQDVDLQLNDVVPSSAHYKSHFDKLHRNNPSYASLRKQQEIVEAAIEHLSVNHCSDLNSAVVAVGHVSKRFGEAVGQVKNLRSQVQEIRANLVNARTSRDNGMNGISESHFEGSRTESDFPTTGNHRNPLGGKSLRELWLKKLESEAVLSLLQKLELIREAPGAFDALVHSQPCRIGAAVVLLSDALNTMFKDDVAQIQALHKIMEQLMTRKQRAEEILWETLGNVLYLRTASASSTKEGSNSTNGRNVITVNGSVSKSKENSKDSGSYKDGSRHVGKGYKQNRYQKNRFVSPYKRKTVGEDSESDSDDDDMTSHFSDEFSARSANEKGIPRTGKVVSRKTASSILENRDAQSMHLFTNYPNHHGRLLPRDMIDCILDLEVDELHCLEDWNHQYYTGNFQPSYSSFSNDGNLIIPRYTDPVMALRILIESLAKLGRLDDVERCVSENVERELRRITQLEQAKTLSKLEKLRAKLRAKVNRRKSTQAEGEAETEEKLLAFRSHLRSLLKSFGCVMLRLNHLAQILRHRITTDPTIVTPSYSSKSSALHSVLVSANLIMQREIKGFLLGCLNEDEEKASSFLNARMVTPSMMDVSVSNRGGQAITGSGRVSAHEQGIFSLGIISDASLATSVREKYAQNISLASKSSAMKMTAEEFVLQVLCPRTGTVPQVRHALVFRKSLAAWQQECLDLKRELATTTQEDISSNEYNATTEESALSYLDSVVKKTLLPMMQDAAVNGTVTALEKQDAFDPIAGTGLYNSSVKGQQLKVEMCYACQGVYTSTGPVFAALHRLPRGGEMYSPLVAVLEHAVLTFISRVKQRISHICDKKEAFILIEKKDTKHATPLGIDMEARRPFSMLLNSYFGEESQTGGNQDIDSTDSSRVRSPINPLAPSSSDTQSRIISNAEDERTGLRASLDSGFEEISNLEREQETFEQEVGHMLGLLNFTNKRFGSNWKLCTEEEFLKAASLAHSLLKLSSLLERRLKPKTSHWGKVMTAPRTLRDSIKNIRLHGLRVAKFCRMEVLLQTVKRLGVTYKSSSLAAKDAVRLPSCVNDLGEYYTNVSDLLRQYGGNKIAAYSMSSLEQYVPLFFMETVRILAAGDGLPQNFKVTLNGVESLDRCCSVLYRDLKGATSFDNSSWDDEVAADAFERAASYVALMELDMEELVSFCRNNRVEFTDDDYKLMFSMDGPRRRGDIERFTVLKDRMDD